MKTRFLIPVGALFLCAALLLGSCSESEPTAPQIGNHTLREGVWQNDLITLTVDDPLTAPVTSLALAFRNNSDYSVSVHYQKLLIEQLCDGAWEELDTPNLVRESYVMPFACEPHTTKTEILIFSENKSSYHKVYPPLEAGDYRMRVPCYQLDLPDGLIKYDIEFVCYFTVAERE